MDHRNPVCTCTCAITAESSWKQTIAVSEWKLNISLTTWKTRLSSMVKYASAGIMHYWKVLPVTLTPEPWPWKYHQCHMDVVMSNCDVSLKYVSAFQRQAKKCIRNCLYVVSLWRSFTVDLLVSKSHHFIYISNCTLTVNLLKFPQAVCMISCVYDIMYMIRHTHTHTHRQNRMPPSANCKQRHKKTHANQHSSTFNQAAASAACTGSDKQHQQMQYVTPALLVLTLYC